ncbi:ribonuclease H-like domain-containing protein [Xylariaceae sp. FL1019]|nr:ribonuclease H-like domain-containing protein [Xylariaceae sp. FL1019]
MPPGYYPVHGLIPLDDYSFMEEVHAEARAEAAGKTPLDTSSSSQSSLPVITARPTTDGPLDTKRRGTGVVFPTRFTPPSASTKPLDVFIGRPIYGRLTRYIHRFDPHQVLIFTDGACLNNGQSNPQAAWGFVHGPGTNGQPLVASGRLEQEGPFGDPGIQSSNRAELRAVIAALRFRHWPGESFSRMVIATDSEYVTSGATEWVKTWIKNGWRTSGKMAVKNQDLWELLLGEVERRHEEGLSI